MYIDLFSCTAARVFNKLTYFHATVYCWAAVVKVSSQ